MIRVNEANESKKKLLTNRVSMYNGINLALDSLRVQICRVEFSDGSISYRALYRAKVSS